MQGRAYTEALESPFSRETYNADEAEISLKELLTRQSCEKKRLRFVKAKY
jgi:hypothetical protein